MVINLRKDEIIVDNKTVADRKIFFWGYFIYNDCFYTGEKIEQLVSSLLIKDGLNAAIPNFSGCYQIVIAEGAKKLLTVIQDRWGTYPLFYTSSDEGYIISSNYRHLIKKDSEYNKSALVEMLGLGHVHGNKTLVDGISEFSQHCVSKIACNTNGTWIKDEESYWDYELNFAKANFKEKSKAFADLWEVKMGILSEGISQLNKATYVPLSAGLDSRIIGSAIDENGLNQHNLTFGCGSDNLEIETALKVSRKFKNACGHHVLNVNQAGYRQLIKEAPSTFRITTAYFGEKDLWYPSKFRNDLGAFLPGHSGDFMAGSHLKSKMKFWRSKADVIRYIVNFKSTPLCKYLYDSDNEFKEVLQSSLEENLIDNGDWINTFMKWDIEERQRRYIMRSVIAENFNQLPLVVMPFFDYDLMDFFVDLPFSFLLNTELYRDSIANYILGEDLKKIPANGRPVKPMTKGMINEYYIKFVDYFQLSRNNTKVFDANIDWSEFIDLNKFPEEIRADWIKPSFFTTNSRFYYSLLEFQRDFNSVKSTL